MSDVWKEIEEYYAYFLQPHFLRDHCNGKQNDSSINWRSVWEKRKGTQWNTFLLFSPIQSFMRVCVCRQWLARLQASHVQSGCELSLKCDRCKHLLLTASCSARNKQCVHMCWCCYILQITLFGIHVNSRMQSFAASKMSSVTHLTCS